VQWAEAYEFADAHNITLVGGALVCPPLAVRPQDNNFTAGSDRTVGVVGGWLQVKPYVPDISAHLMLSTQGGGHGVLSNTMGLGVDRVVGQPAPDTYPSPRFLILNCIR
jgi:hypothetical protein